MTLSKRVLPLALAFCAATAWGQSNQREPHIGYVYPAGGQQGDVFEITIGGQSLKNVSDVYVSGKGVTASVVEHYGRLKNLNTQQRQGLRTRIRELTQKRLGELDRKGSGLTPRGRDVLRNLRNEAKPKAAGKRRKGKRGTTRPAAAELPDHPLFRNLEERSLRELQHLRNQLLNFRKKQRNAQLAESVVVKVTINRNAAPGDREIRLGTPRGLTNPMCFQVGLLSEAREQEPNDPKGQDLLVEVPPLDLPILLNGQIEPGDVDRFRFKAERGQRLVIETRARHLIPYLADAVPGWFQATVALYDDKGREVAFADDYRFDPDPVLFYEVPETGEYELEIRDSIYRGRKDFVYRVAVGQQPFVTGTFPLGAKTGVRTIASVDGWNLPRKRLPLDTQHGAGHIRRTAVRKKKLLSNPVTYAVDSLPQSKEAEPNDTTETAQRITLPRTINGRIGEPGDVDVFQFKGRAGDEVVAEVFARRLNSPVDSLLRLTDASGQVLAWNDDCDDKESGLCTHHADSYLRARLPANGLYRVRVADSQRHGGDANAYRLRIGPPRPDFALRVTPSTINVPRGRSAVPIRAHAMRKDGFDGDIELVLVDPPPGFSLQGGRIPGGRDTVRMTLTAPRKPLGKPVVLKLEGRAVIDGRTVSRPAVPADDMMQAFLYRHLVPSRELMVAVMGKRWGPPVELAGGPVRIPLGGTTDVQIRNRRGQALREIEFELSEPPTGVTLEEVSFTAGALSLRLSADRDAAKVGFADNLIVEAFKEVEWGKKGKGGGKGKQQKRRVSVGILPAIPFEIVR